MTRAPITLVALSGGVDSAVAAWLLSQRGQTVECLHMSNWEGDDAYCEAAADLKDAVEVCERLGLVLHRVDFAREYRETVFENFLADIRAGLTPNPDILCNREIKFGVLRSYARRLGATTLATGHYARLERHEGEPVLLKGHDQAKDQSYFLHAVATEDLENVSFPLGGLDKPTVRSLAARAGLGVAGKRDSTGICFIGERPFADFLERYIEPCPGPIVTDTGETIGEHEGLHRYTLGQRKGIGIGGICARDEAPWYVAAKDAASNTLVVVQGHEHPALLSTWLETAPPHWIGPVHPDWSRGKAFRCRVKTRYRQADQLCTLEPAAGGGARVRFELPQRAVTPGQYAVFYRGERCLGGARIEHAESGAVSAAAAARAG